MGEDREKVMSDEFELDGMFGDIISALDRTRDIVCTASKITDEAAKKALFAGAKIILANCIDAIDGRETADDEPVMEEDD